MPKTLREIAMDRFHGSRETLMRMVKANPKGLTKDMLENGSAQVTDMTKLAKQIEGLCKSKPMTEQFEKFAKEWSNACKGKGMGKISHYLEKMGNTEFGTPPEVEKAEPKAPPRPTTSAPMSPPKK